MGPAQGLAISWRSCRRNRRNPAFFRDASPCEKRHIRGRLRRKAKNMSKVTCTCLRDSSKLSGTRSVRCMPGCLLLSVTHSQIVPFTARAAPYYRFFKDVYLSTALQMPPGTKHPALVRAIAQKWTELLAEERQKYTDARTLEKQQRAAAMVGGHSPMKRPSVAFHPLLDRFLLGSCIFLPFLDSGLAHATQFPWRIFRTGQCCEQRCRAEVQQCSVLVGAPFTSEHMCATSCWLSLLGLAQTRHKRLETQCLLLHF